MANSVSEALHRPEVELRMKTLGNEWSYPDKNFVTSLDLLEVYTDSKTTVTKDMGQADFAEYCNKNDFMGSDGPLLRVFFLEELYLPPPLPSQVSGETEGSSASSSIPGDGDITAFLMHKHFGVPMLFFLDQSPYINQTTTGNVTFVCKNKEGKKASLDGYYQFCSDYYTDKPGYVWFSQSFDPRTRASNYIVYKAPAVTKRLVFDCAQGLNWLSLTRPFAIDAFLMNDCIIKMNHQVNAQRAKLLEMEAPIIFDTPSSGALNVKNLKSLYVAAREFCYMRDNLDALKDTLDYLLEALKEINDPANSGQQIIISDQESVQSSLVLLKSKANWTTRELSSLEVRAKLRMDLENSLAMNQHNPTNLSGELDKLKTDDPEKRVSDSASTIAPSAETTIRQPSKPWRRLLPAFLLKMIN